MIIDLRQPNLRKSEVGVTVITSKGFKWKLIERKKGIEKWLDVKTKLVWYATKENDINHYEATIKYKNLLPTKTELEMSEKHNIREILSLGHQFYWSSSPYPDDSFTAYYFDGDSGRMDENSRNDGGSVLCVVNK